MLDENGVLQYKESHLPIAAKFHLERLNKSTPQHLRKKIEVVSGQQQTQNQSDEQAQTIEKLKAEIEALKQQQLRLKASDAITPVGASNLGKTPSAGPNMTSEQAVQQTPATAVKIKPATPNSNPQN